MSSTDRFVRRQERIARDVKIGAIHPRLPYSSVDGGSLPFLDLNGDVQTVVGQQWDGTVTTASMGGTTPVAPTVPLATPKPGGLALYWDGTYVDDSPTRMDFRRVTFHAVTDVEDLDVLDPAQIVGEVTIATGGEVFASLPPVEHFIFATTWTDAGKFSVESDVAFATPLSIVEQEAFDDVLVEIGDLQAEVADAPAVFREPVEPTVEAGKKAIWYDTASGNVPWFFDGTAWSQMQVGEGALAIDAVIASTIAVGALDGKVITGPLIQTDAAADTGIKLVNDSLVAFDALGDPTFLLDGADGSLSLVGPVVAGGSITGTTFQTSSLADTGLKIVGSVLTAYDGDNEPRFVANGATGEVVVTGTYRSRFAPDQRVEIATGPASDPLVDKDFSSVKFFSGVAGEGHSSVVSAPNASISIHSGVETEGQVGTSSWMTLSPVHTGDPSQGGIQLQAPKYIRLNAAGSPGTGGGGGLTLGGAADSRAPDAASSLTAFGSGTKLDLLLGATRDIILGTGTAVTAKVVQNGQRLEAAKITGLAGARLPLGSGNSGIQIDGSISPIGAYQNFDGHIWLAAGKRIYQSGIAAPRVNDSGWIALPLVSGFTALDSGTYGSPAYRIINGTVFLRGLVTGPSLDWGFAQLPLEARPAAGTMHVYSTRGDHSSGAVAGFVRGNDGVCYASHNGTFIFLAGLGPFPTDN